MWKTLQIAWWTLRSALRARLLALVVTTGPLGLALLLALALEPQNAPRLQQAPVRVVNLDAGQAGETLAQALQALAFQGVVAVEVSDDESAVRGAVKRDELAAAIIIPPGFSDSLQPAHLKGEQAWTFEKPIANEVEIYTSPHRPAGAALARSAVETALVALQTPVLAGQVALSELLAWEKIDPRVAALQGEAWMELVRTRSQNQRLVEVKLRYGRLRPLPQTRVDWLGYYTPAMAVFYLGLLASWMGRKLAAELENRVARRLLEGPLQPLQYLPGWLLGVFLAGGMQLFVILVTGQWLYGLEWGDPAALAALATALVWAAAAWGVLIGVASGTAQAAGQVGLALNLIFAAAAGCFWPRPLLPGWLQALSFVTPHAWGLEGLLRLMDGATAPQIAPLTLVLLAMGGVVFAVSVLLFSLRIRK